ncbi:hypothetical protein MACK_002252 [Theileria orientalis]|uniref:Uncharacterized protein n=1 Tax=Theileria orientalis TaxID=68886 RepID=A0A976QUV7_THEOR|nr:hypothetical protein MACK_002252 [Theileria orientalis]
MVEIILDHTSGSYDGGNEKVNVSKSVCEKYPMYEKVTYQIEYKYMYTSYFTFYIYQSYFTLYIRPTKGGTPFFTYYSNIPTHAVNEAEVYYSKKHPETPLLVGFKRHGSEEFQYFTLKDLKHKGSHTGYPPNIYFNADELETKLNSENTTRNTITFSLDRKSEHVKRSDEPYEDFVRSTYSVDSSVDGPYILSTDKLYGDGNISDIISGFTTVKNKSFDFIIIYSNQNKVPLFIEFIDHSTPTKHFKRETKDGKKWKETSVESADFVEEDKKNILKYTSFLVSKSVVVFLNKLGDGSQYPFKLLENCETTVLSYERTSMQIQFNPSSQFIGDLKYKCYYHDLSKSVDDPSMNLVSGLKLFINCDSDSSDSGPVNDIEIKLFDSSGTSPKIIYYKPRLVPQTEGNSNSQHVNRVYVYFNDGDNVPLLVYIGNNFFAPSTKDEYFNKWLEVKELKDIEPMNPKTVNHVKFVAQFEKTNLELNQIFLNNTKDYGLEANGKTPKNLNLSRVKVSQELVNDKHRKIVHSIVKGSIGKIKANLEEIRVDNKQKLYESLSGDKFLKNYNTITLYCHLSDSEYKSFLLMAISSTTSINTAINTLYYEVAKRSDHITWTRIQSSEASHLRSEPGLSNRINHIHYKFTKSLRIQVEKQENNYSLKAIENENLSGSIETTGAENIGVSKSPDCSAGSDYVCYKHTIPFLTGHIKPEEIGGLRLFISDMEVTTYGSNGLDKLPIYYKDSEKIVNVYFYKGNKVPLFVKYDNKYYKPKNKDEYFTSWILASDITDDINKLLNQVNISVTKNGKYGLALPSGQRSSYVDQTFCNRISVETCKSAYYRKITHSTINGLPIGSIKYHTETLSIKTTTPSYYFDVYYETTDYYFTKPLLLSFSNEWYLRSNMQGTEWSKESGPGKFTKSNIRNQMNSILSKLFAPLNVQIEKQDLYDGIIISRNNFESMKISGQIRVDKLMTPGAMKVTNYRCCEHEIYDFYTTNKQTIVSSLHLNPDLSLELILNVSTRQIRLFDKENNVIPILFYRNSDAEVRKSVYIYFYEGDRYTDTDTVPLVVYFDNKYYKPECKDTYFKYWKQFYIDTNDIDRARLLLKQNLDETNYLLNEVDPLKLSSYGVPCCKKHDYFKITDFDSKRIDVVTFRNDGYIMHIHTPKNKSKISNLKAVSTRNLDKHSTALKTHDIDEVAVIFKTGNMSHPKLILLNQRNTYSSFSETYGYYYYDTPIGRSYQYTFGKIEYGSYLVESLKNGTQDYGSGPEIDPIKSTLKLITAPLVLYQTQGSHDIDIGCNEYDDPIVNQCLVTDETEIASAEADLGQTSLNPLRLNNNLHQPASDLLDPGFQQLSVPLPPEQRDVKSPLPVASQSSHHPPAPSVLLSSPESSDIHATYGSSAEKNSQDLNQPTELTGGSASLEKSPVTTHSSDSESSYLATNLVPHQGEPGETDSSIFQKNSLGSLSPDRIKVESPPSHSPKSSVELPISEDGSLLNDGLSNSDGHAFTPRSGSGSTSTRSSEEQTTLDQIKEFIVKNPEVVGGASGGVATAAGGSYPLYKLVVRCKK